MTLYYYLEETRNFKDDQLLLYASKAIYMKLAHNNKILPPFYIFFNYVNKRNKILWMKYRHKQTWSAHTTSVQHTLTPLIGVLRRHSFYLTDKYKKLIYYDLIEARLLYLVTLW